MTLRVYRSTGYLSRSVIVAALVAEVKADQRPEDEAAFADQYGGDIIEESFLDIGEEDEQIRHG